MPSSTAFAATYPFHPTVISVFERKWQELPRFQQTRGVLRMLALWVSKAYQEGYKGAHKDLLIGLGTAPLDDPMFRAALFEQLGEGRLEGAVTTDICGKTATDDIAVPRILDLQEGRVRVYLVNTPGRNGDSDLPVGDMRRSCQFQVKMGGGRIVFKRGADDIRVIRAI